jgi:oligosaccharide repeat unit polymerase
MIACLNTSIKKELFSPSNAIAVVYVGSLATALLLSAEYEKYSSNEYRDNLPAALFFAVAFFISFLPALLFKENKVKKIILPSGKVINTLSWGWITISIYSLAYFTPIAVEIFSYDNNSAVRFLIAEGKHPFISPSIFNTAAGSVATFFLIPMTLGFINLLTNKQKTGALLIASSLCYPAFVFAYFGRDGVIFWISALVMQLMFFRYFLDVKLTKMIRKWILLSAIPLFAAFTYITLQRFSSENSIVWPILDYYGQAFLNFSQVYGSPIDPTLGGFTFSPIFNLVVGHEFNPAIIEAQIEATGSHTWLFGTYINQLYIDFSTYGTILLLGFTSISCLIFFTSSTQRMKLGSIIFYIFYTQILFQSVFYFRNYNNIGNFYLVVMPIFCILLNKTKICQVIEKRNSFHQ